MEAHANKVSGGVVEFSQTQTDDATNIRVQKTNVQSSVNGGIAVCIPFHQRQPAAHTSGHKAFLRRSCIRV